MNSITMKMQADKLIRMALQEDITSEDVSTNAVMRSAVKGTVDLIARKTESLPDWMYMREYSSFWMRKQKSVSTLKTVKK